MDNVVDLVNQAMSDWDQETDGGLTDPAFQGKLGQEIDLLVDSLNQEEVNLLLKNEVYTDCHPLQGSTQPINGIWVGDTEILGGPYNG